MQIKKKVYEAYCNHGVATACDEANKHNQVKYEYCKACENDMPAIDHECLICGQETKPRNQTKELFTQGDFEIRTNHPYRDWETDRKSTRLNSSHITRSRMPSSA